MAVLKYKDPKTGAWAITSGSPGSPGKSAYASAQEGGFTGTEAEFYTLLGALGVDAGGAKVVAGVYTGTGKYGSSNPCELTFGFVPVILAMFGEKGVLLHNAPYSNVTYGVIGSPALLTTEYQANALFPQASSSTSVYAKRVDNTVYWYDSSADLQMNKSGQKYNYVAIG